MSILSKESISPKPFARRLYERQTFGKIMLDIADMLATATSETEHNVLRFWKDTISQFQFLYDIQQRNVSDHSNVILALMGRRFRKNALFYLEIRGIVSNFALNLRSCTPDFQCFYNNDTTII